jgi:tryptophanyl-tRNA synthetase
MLKVLLALGLGGGKGEGKGGSTVFVQSHVRQHAELMWILSCTASMGYLGRMTQWKVCLTSLNRIYFTWDLERDGDTVTRGG